MEEYRKAMVGIYTGTVNSDTIDECPMAYKPPDRITEVIGDTVRIRDILKPVYNYKGS